MHRLTLTVVAFLALAVMALGQNNNRCPYCTGLTCGPDGAGGTCGTCPAGQTCIRGQCVCNRDCTAKQCGPDNCGNDCGECLTGQTCVNNICTGACSPQCIRTVNGAAKSCGWDRCTSNCGSCPTGYRCKDGVCLCYPNCKSRNCGPDGCGGSCGTCTSDAVCNSDTTDALYGTCYKVCNRCGDGVCSSTETSTTTRASQFNLTYCPADCGSITGIISLAVGQKDQLNNITVDFFDLNPYLNDREMAGKQTQTVISDTKGAFGIYNAALTGGDQGQEKRIYFRLRGVTTDRTSGATVPLLDLWWNFALINSPNLNFSPNFYFYMSPYFTDTDALFRVILSWGTLLSDRATTIPDVDLFVAGPVDSDTMAASDPAFRNGIINFANKNYKSTNAEEILPFAKTVADSAQGFGPEVIDVLHDVRVGAPDQSIGVSTQYPSNANEVNEYEFWVDRPNSNSNADNAFQTLSDTNSFLVIYRGSSVGPTVANQQVFFGDYPGAAPYLFGFYNDDPYNAIPDTAAAWHVFNLALRSLNSDTNLGSVSTTNIFEFQSIPTANKWAYDTSTFAPTKTIPCSHTTANGVPGNLAYCPYTLSYPQSSKKNILSE